MKKLINLTLAISVISIISGCQTIPPNPELISGPNNQVILEKNQTYNGNLELQNQTLVLQENSKLNGTIQITNGHLQIKNQAQINGQINLEKSNLVTGDQVVINGPVTIKKEGELSIGGSGKYLGNISVPGKILIGHANEFQSIETTGSTILLFSKNTINGDIKASKHIEIHDENHLKGKIIAPKFSARNNNKIEQPHKPLLSPTEQLLQSSFEQ